MPFPGLVCRDVSPDGLRFYVNIFYELDPNHIYSWVKKMWLILLSLIWLSWLSWKISCISLVMRNLSIGCLARRWFFFSSLNYYYYWRLWFELWQSKRIWYLCNLDQSELCSYFYMRVNSNLKRPQFSIKALSQIFLVWTIYSAPDSLIFTLDLFLMGIFCVKQTYLAITLKYLVQHFFGVLIFLPFSWEWLRANIYTLLVYKLDCNTEEKQRYNLQ